MSEAVETKLQMNACPLCRANKVTTPCRGHLQVADGESGADEAGEIPVDLKVTQDEINKEDNTEATDESEGVEEGDSYSDLYDVHGLFNTDDISDLLSDEELVIKHDTDLDTLSVRRVTYKPEWLSTKVSNELRKFIDALLKELEEFKKEHGLSDNCFSILKDSQGNFLSLRIHLPDPALYQAFIARLSSKNLLPAQTVKQLEKTSFEKGMNHFHPNRLTPRLTFSTKSKKDKDDEDKLENTYRSPNPFKTQLTRDRR